MAQLEIAPNFGLRGFRRALVIGVAAIALTSFFIVSGFPYDRLAPRVSSAIESFTGTRVRFGELDIGMVWLLPELRAQDVTVARPQGRPFVFERVRLRPVLSTSWLRGIPALRVALRSRLGEADGIVVAGTEPGFDGTLRDVSLAELPLGDIAAGTYLDGRADATIDLRMREAGPEGRVVFEANAGSITLPVLPIGIPFDKLSADLEVGGDAFARLASLDLAGPLASLTASGTLGRAPTIELAPLALQTRIEAREPAMRSMLQSQGLALDASGGTALTISGTLDAPNVVPARAPGRSR